nr:E3 ubiquitin-protein ligase RNF181 isoform X1 [Nothobranchius furzeri]XP_054587272.1 E3 ubiquitin-protein ligase RNF181 isoform X1 [Nothobranchius furzeri]
MASYFDEHDCEPTNPEEQYRQNALLELARSLMQGLDLMDSGVFDLSDWDQRLPPPAAKAAIQTLTVVVISPEQADKGLKCPVCLLEFEEQETVREMPCKHLFHSGCILPWLGKTNSCPLCRLELPTDNPEYEEFKKDKVSLWCCLFVVFSVNIVFLSLGEKKTEGTPSRGPTWSHVHLVLPPTEPFKSF